MARPVVHFEIGAKDADKAKKFYSQLFDWKIDSNNPMNYGMVPAAGEGSIGGGIMGTGNNPNYVTFYVQVDNLQATLDKAAELGGGTVVPPTEIPGTGKFAMLHDLEGNVVGLFSS